MKVSIIIPTYRRQQFIRRAIRSALEQKNVEVEVIVVDDNGLGSEYQKSNFEELKSFIENKQITYIAHKHNKNGSAARNTGLSKATGDFIAFLDDDDEFEPNKIYEQIKTMNIDSSDACLSTFARVYGDKVTKITTPKIDADFPVKLLAVNVDTCAGSCLILRKKLIDKIGLFDESFSRFQDLEYLYRVSKMTEISVATSSKTNINMHDGNIKHRPAADILEYHKHFLQTFQSDINQCGRINKQYILDQHYIKISKSYIKEKNFIKGLMWSFRTSNPIKSSTIIISDFIKYILNLKLKKAIVPTKEKYVVEH